MFQSVRRKRVIHDLQALMAIALGRSRAELRGAARSAARANTEFARGLARIATQPAPALQWPCAGDFVEALRRDGRPLILATLHLGHYPAGLLALAPHLAWLERVTIIRRNRDPAVESRLAGAFAQRGLELEIAHTRRHPARQALSALRAGRSLVLLYDVPPDFDLGRTWPVDLFRRPARLPAGPADLARIGGALLWPLALLPAGDGFRMHSGAPLAWTGEPRDHWRDLATRALAAHAEQAIARAPGDWLLWSRLPAIWASPAPP